MNLLEMSQAASGLDETTAFEVDTANMPEVSMMSRSL